MASTRGQFARARTSPSSRVHHERGGALGAVGLPDLAERLLDLVLDRGVERQLHAGAGDRALRVADLDVLAEGVLDEAALAVRPVQQVVLGVLQPGQPVAVGADHAEDLRGQRAARVVAQVARGELDPGQAQLADAVGVRAAGSSRRR